MNNPVIKIENAVKKVASNIIAVIRYYIHLLLWAIPALWVLVLIIYILDVEIPFITYSLEGTLSVLYTWTALPQFWPVYLLVWVEVGQFYLFRKSRQYQSRRLTPVRGIYLVGVVYYVVIGMAGFRELALWTSYPWGGVVGLIVLCLTVCGCIFSLTIRRKDSSHRHVRWLCGLLLLFAVSSMLYTWFFTLRPSSLGVQAVILWLSAGTATRLILLWTTFRLLETVFVYFRIWLRKPFFWRSMRTVVGDAVGNADWRKEELKRNATNYYDSKDRNTSIKILRVYDYLWKIEPESRFRQLAVAYAANRSHSALLKVSELPVYDKKEKSEEIAIYFNTLVNVCYLETGMLRNNSNSLNGNSHRWNQWVTWSYLYIWSQQLARLTGDEQSFILEVPEAPAVRDRVSGKPPNPGDKSIDGLYRRLRRNGDNRQELLAIYADLYNTMVESEDAKVNQFIAFHFFAHLADNEYILKLRVAEELGAVCLFNEDVNRRVAVLYNNKSNQLTGGPEHLKGRYENLKAFHEKQAAFFLYSNNLGFRWIPGFKEPVNPEIPGDSPETKRNLNEISEINEINEK